MKVTAKTVLIALASAGSVFAGTATTVAAPNPCPEEVTSSGIYDGNLFAPEEGDPAYKIAADEKYGFQFAGDMALAYWNTEDSAPGANNNSFYFLLHAQAAKNIVQDNVNGGLWFRTEVSASLGLDKTTRHADPDFNGGVGAGTDAHADIFGGNKILIPEMLLTQYYNKKKVAVSFGMVNLTNYFDAVGIANDSFASFTNTGLVNSTILPLVDSNLGAVVQYEINDDNYAMVAVSRTSTESGYNPFRSGRGYAVVGEFGHTFADGDATVRINPFYDVDVEGGKDDNYGLVASIEYAVNDNVSVYSRAGFSGDDELGNGFEFSVGTHISPFSSREDDFVGIAYVFTKPAGCDAADSEVSNSENVVEVIYSYQVTDAIKVVPHFQYIHGGAESYKKDQCIFGVQTVYSF